MISPRRSGALVERPKFAPGGHQLGADEEGRLERGEEQEPEEHMGALERLVPAYLVVEEGGVAEDLVGRRGEQVEELVHAGLPEQAEGSSSGKTTCSALW